MIVWKDCTKDVKVKGDEADRGVGEREGDKDGEREGESELEDGD
jgi:hypothetical protein